MIEVLVALLIFLVGILGFIGLRTVLARAGTEADLRANAAYLASEVIGRMWADVSNLSGFAGADECSAAACTEWHAKVQQQLPGASATITVDTGTGNVSVLIGWTLPGGISHKFETQSNISVKTAS